jgi:RHS repeat-associated protein
VTVGTAVTGYVSPDATTCTSDAFMTSATARFKYDFRNRRIASWRAETNEWVYTFFDQAGQPLAELARPTDPTARWRLVREYVWLEGKPIAQIEYDAATGAFQTYAVHTDAIGMPRALTASRGATVWTASVARPYGDIAETTTPDPETGKTVVTNLRLPGQYDERLLGTLGLQGPYYNWNRWYLPSMGRYLELDPIAKAGGFNTPHGVDWYGYAFQNPLMWVDPRGEWPGTWPMAPQCLPACQAAQKAMEAKMGACAKCTLDVWTGTGGDANFPLGPPKTITYCYCAGICRGGDGKVGPWVGGNTPSGPVIPQ